MSRQPPREPPKQKNKKPLIRLNDIMNSLRVNSEASPDFDEERDEDDLNFIDEERDDSIFTDADRVEDNRDCIRANAEFLLRKLEDQHTRNGRLDRELITQLNKYLNEMLDFTDDIVTLYHKLDEKFQSKVEKSNQNQQKSQQYDEFGAGPSGFSPSFPKNRGSFN